MHERPQAILEVVLAIVHRLSGRPLEGGADKLIGGEHRLDTWDSIELMEELERAYGVDLAPFAEARATTRKGWFRTYKVPGDVTPREIADFIASAATS
jgi:hypothetical protein